jgi:hypothetical protein
LRAGFDANAVELDFEELASKLLTNETALKALEPENALWRGRLNDWARRSAAHFAAGDSPFPEHLVASCGVKPFFEPQIARYLVVAWAALGIELLSEFLGDIVRRGRENRDANGLHRLEALVRRAVEAGAVTPSEILERIEPSLPGRNSPKRGVVAQHVVDAEKQRFIDRIRKILKRMRQHPGKVRAEVKAEVFGFPTRLVVGAEIK